MCAKHQTKSVSWLCAKKRSCKFIIIMKKKRRENENVCLLPPLADVSYFFCVNHSRISSTTKRTRPEKSGERLRENCVIASLMEVLLWNMSVAGAASLNDSTLQPHSFNQCQASVVVLLEINVGKLLRFVICHEFLSSSHYRWIRLPGQISRQLTRLKGNYLKFRGKRINFLTNYVGWQ